MAQCHTRAATVQQGANIHVHMLRFLLVEVDDRSEVEGEERYDEICQHQLRTKPCEHVVSQLQHRSINKVRTHCATHLQQTRDVNGETKAHTVYAVLYEPSTFKGFESIKLKIPIFYVQAA